MCKKITNILFAIFFVFLLANVSYAQASDNKNFLIWKEALIREMLSKGISEETIVVSLKNLKGPNNKVLKYYNKQPEKIITLEDYLKRTISKSRINKGKALKKKHEKKLNIIAKKYGVPAEYIVAIWGLETNFGNYTGGFNVISSLSTLAFASKRKAFFRKELFNALNILDDRHIEYIDMKGSWAGAMGQGQFMPSSFLAYGVDGNNDNKIDIWYSLDDIFASIANYLSKHGWSNGEPWGEEVAINRDISNKIVGLNHTESVQNWLKRGLYLSSEKTKKGNLRIASLVSLDKDRKRGYIVYNNFRIIMRYNNSIYYALSVSLLSNEYKIF